MIIPLYIGETLDSGYNETHTKYATQNTYNGLEEITGLSAHVNYMSGYS